jgi:hypothetical protein
MVAMSRKYARSTCFPEWWSPFGKERISDTVRSSTVPRDGAATGVDGRTTLTVGDGRARVDIITFSGDITIERR